MYLSRGVKNKCFFSKRRCTHAVWKNIVYFVTLHDKYAISWSKNNCKISRKFTIGFFVPTYNAFVAKYNKINNIFPNGVCATPFGKKSFFCNTSRQIHCKLKQKSQQNKSKISDLCCKRFLFQLRVYFVVYIYIGNFRYIPTYFVSVFCSNLECILSYIYRKFPIYLLGFFVPT